MLDFSATYDGLQDQMLGTVVRAERPDLEEAREKLILEDAANKATLKAIEDRILELMAASKGNILDDEVLITTLAESKSTSNQVRADGRTDVRPLRGACECVRGWGPCASHPHPPTPSPRGRRSRGKWKLRSARRPRSAPHARGMPPSPSACRSCSSASLTSAKWTRCTR